MVYWAMLVPPQQGETHASLDLFGHPVAQDLGEAVHHERHAAVGAGVLGAADLLADEPEEFGGAGPDLFPPGDGDALDADHGGEGDDGERGEAESDPRVLTPQEGEDADDEEHVGDDSDDERGEEVRQGCDVAVDAFDHLARGVFLVEAHVEVEDVGRQVGAELVGGGPPDVLGEPGGDDGEALVGHRDAHEPQGDRHQRPSGFTVDGAVEESADELRVDELEGDDEHDEERQQGDAGALGPQVGLQQSEVSPDRDHVRRVLRGRETWVSQDGQFRGGRNAAGVGSVPVGSGRYTAV